MTKVLVTLMDASFPFRMEIYMCEFCFLVIMFAFIGNLLIFAIKYVIGSGEEGTVDSRY